MGEKPDQIERHIDEQRAELGQNINELQQKVKTAVDWRAQLEQRPFTMMGLALGGGVVLSLLFGGRSRSKRSQNWPRQRDRAWPVDYAATGAENRDWNHSSNREWTNRRSGPTGADTSTWDNIRGAALAVAGSRLGTLLEGVLPGFQEQYNRRQQNRQQDRRSATLSTSRPNGPESDLPKSNPVTDYSQRS